MSASEHQLSYAFASTLHSSKTINHLSLCASNIDENTAFFEGEILNPIMTAKCLRQLSLVVAARYYLTPSMRERLIRESDPVVTVSESMLRFEGFSACCSVYTRVDVLSGALNASKHLPGTTNVDFNAEMRALLASYRPNDTMRLSVSADDITLNKAQNQVREKKVTLPRRWIKGLSEVQSLQADMLELFRLSKNDALLFFRQLPKAKTKQACWLVSGGRGVRLAHRKVTGGLRITGLERLRTLEQLLTHADGLVIFANQNKTMSAWVLTLPNHVFTLVLSEETWRGFSGEGQLLKYLAQSQYHEHTNKIKAHLKWQNQIDSDSLANELNLDKNKVNGALSVLANSGLVGFDLSEHTYFHRVLPFALSDTEKLNPRLKAANLLITNKHVKVIEKKPEKLEIEVQGSDTVHRVTGTMTNPICTCPWYAKHQLERGPCKHILAALMMEK